MAYKKLFMLLPLLTVTACTTQPAKRTSVADLRLQAAISSSVSCERLKKNVATAKAAAQGKYRSDIGTGWKNPFSRKNLQEAAQKREIADAALIAEGKRQERLMQAEYNRRCTG